jgi:hypothetical protein
MGFMDKVKAQAEQAMVKAQQGASQAQGKLDEHQAKRTGDALVAALGAAFYAEQRQGGPTQAVTDALGALDAHVAANGPLLPSAPPSLLPPRRPPARRLRIPQARRHPPHRPRPRRRPQVAHSASTTSDPTDGP